MHYSIAIDGPAAAGKTTQAKALAKKLGFLYVNTGALYRTIALYMLRTGKGLDGIEDVLKGIDMDACLEDGEQRMYLSGEDVTDQLYTPEVSKLASDASAIPAVRAFLLEVQQRFGREHNVVMEGRDIGTVILPNATLKVFLTATPTVRAERRQKELASKGIHEDLEKVKREMIERDHNDSTREAAPLLPAEGAFIVDGSKLSIDEVSKEILTLYFMALDNVLTGKPVYAIACVDLNGAIGNEGKLLFNIPSDLARFRELTMDHIVIMGRKTLESLPGGNPLPGRRNLVVTRHPEKYKGVECFRSPLEALRAAQAMPEKKVFVIGGGSVYEALLPYCRRAYLTKVNTRADKADAWFPELPTGWREVVTAKGSAISGGGYGYEFIHAINPAPLP